MTDSAPYYNQLSGNSGNGFPSSTIIPANSYFIVLVDGDGSTPTGFSADYDPVTYCQYCSLGDNGDSVILTDASDNIVDQVDYDDGSPWPTGPDGSFYSLEIKAGKNNYYGANWQASIPEYGSPGKKSSEAWDTNLTSSDNLTISSPDNVYITSNETINNLVDEKYYLLDSHFDSTKDSLDSKTVSKYDSFRKEYDNNTEELLKKLKQDCELTLLNNR